MLETVRGLVHRKFTVFLLAHFVYIKLSGTETFYTLRESCRNQTS